jgi:hypothetical protein
MPVSAEQAERGGDEWRRARTIRWAVPFPRTGRALERAALSLAEMSGAAKSRPDHRASVASPSAAAWKHRSGRAPRLRRSHHSGSSPPSRSRTSPREIGRFCGNVGTVDRASGFLVKRADLYGMRRSRTRQFCVFTIAPPRYTTLTVSGAYGLSRSRSCLRVDAKSLWQPVC